MEFNEDSRRKIRNYLLSPFRDIYKKSSTKGHGIAALDGIRGLAVLLVVASHTNSFGMSGQGSLGVFLFYFLSGYLLSVPYAEYPNNILSIREIKNYFLNRLLRILPTYAIFVGVTAITLGLEQDRVWYFWNISFVKGWNHFWAVAELARFYVLFPLVIAILALTKNGALRILMLICLSYLAYEFRKYHLIDMMDGRKAEFYFYIFLSGSLTCFLISSAFIKKYLDNIYAKKMFSAAAILIFLFLFYSSTYMVDNLWRLIFTDLPKDFSLNGWVMPGVWTILFVILFFSLTFYSEGAINRLLMSSFFRHIGLLSFSIYLVHIAIMTKFQQYGFSEEALFAVVLPTSYFVAVVSYILVEKPFLSLKSELK